MNREYGILERLSDASDIWRDLVVETPITA